MVSTNAMRAAAGVMSILGLVACTNRHQTPRAPASFTSTRTTTPLATLALKLPPVVAGERCPDAFEGRIGYGKNRLAYRCELFPPYPNTTFRWVAVH